MGYINTNPVAVRIVKRRPRTLGMIMAPPGHAGGTAEGGAGVYRGIAGGGTFHIPAPVKPKAPTKPVKPAPVRPKAPAPPKAPTRSPVKPVVGTTGPAKKTVQPTQQPSTPSLPPVDPTTVNTLNTNPTALTPQQWQALQDSGVLPSTLPQSDASLLPNASSTPTTDDPQCLALGLTGGPYPYCTAAPTAAATTSTPFDFSMVPTWAWVFMGIGVLWYMKKKKR